LEEVCVAGLFEVDFGIDRGIRGQGNLQLPQRSECRSQVRR
jgi:hypothetical protein